MTINSLIDQELQSAAPDNNCNNNFTLRLVSFAIGAGNMSERFYQAGLFTYLSDLTDPVRL